MKNGPNEKPHRRVVRETNPGRPRGRRAFYHSTHNAVVVGEARTRRAGRNGKGRLAGRQETGNWELRTL